MIKIQKIKVVECEALPPVLTLQDVKKLLNKSINTINAWVKAGLLPQPKIIGATKYFSTRKVLESVGLECEGVEFKGAVHG